MEYIFIYIIIFILGIVIGSFLNVCIYRIPKHEDIIKERSHCLKCGDSLKWYELIPLVSYILQGGKCRHCKTNISIQYPIIEFLNGAWYVVVFFYNGVKLDSLLFAICGSILIVLSIIDWRTFEIPFGCNLLIFFLGIVRLISDYKHWYIYVIGFFSVSGFFYLIYLFTERRGMGGGDIKLMAAAGLLLGFADIIVAMIIGCIAGAVIHVTLMTIKDKGRQLAFGPYLSLGIMISMIYGEELINWYLGFFR